MKKCSAAGILHFFAMVFAVIAQAILWRQKSSILIKSLGMPLKALMTEVAKTSCVNSLVPTMVIALEIVLIWDGNP